MTPTLLNPTRSQRRFIATLTGALALGSLSLGLGANDVHKKQIDDSLKQGLDSNYVKGSNKVDIGKKGGAKRSFTITQSNTGGVLKVTLLHVGGTDFGRQASLEYDEQKRTVLIAAGGKQLVVTINATNTVTVGGATCPGTSPGCIADAVIAGMPGLIAEEVAAMLGVLNEDLHNKPYGEHISTTLLQLSAQLNKQSMPKPK